MKKVLLTGGGTLGSVVPLIALAEELGNRCQYYWLGTAEGPERAVVTDAGISFQAIRAGKLRRYLHWRNFVDPFLSMAGFVQAWQFCRKWKPDLVVSAGGFVAVPVVWAAKMCGAKVLLYQLDVRPGLANRLCLKAANKVAVVWPQTKAFFGDKAVLGRAQVRRALHVQARQTDAAGFKQQFSLRVELPLVLVTGGGTGAQGLNKLLIETLPDLIGNCVVLHATGKGRGLSGQPDTPDYRAIDFLSQEQMAQALAVSAVVVSRAGMGTLSELSYSAKPVILVPLPDSHQEENADLVVKAEAAILIKQGSDPQKLAQAILLFIRKQPDAQELGDRLKKLLSGEEGSSLTKLALDLLHEGL